MKWVVVAVMLAAALTVQASDDTNSVQAHQGHLWAVLLAGSNSWMNYRHQADVCHAYQILHQHGVPDERIIVMMYDDLAHNEENPTPGVVINRPDGPNVYPGVLKDYTGKDVTPENFLKVLRGDAEGMKGVGSGRVLKTGPNDRVFINMVDHGAPGLFAFPDEILNATDLADALLDMHTNQKYREMVLYVESCESGSLFKNLLPKDIKVRAFRKGLPKEVTKAKIKKGEVASLENDEGIKVFNWKDKRNVFILSTVPEHDDKLIATGKLSRNGEEIKKPKCVMDYNKAKKGVDLSDQLSSYYTALRKNRKWYKKVALELVTGSCVVNAFIIFNKYLSDKKWTLLQFKESIILSLLTDSPFEKIRPGRKLSYKVSPSGPQHFLSEAEGSKRESRKRCVGCYEMISTNEGSKVASKRAKKISTFCSSCDGKPYLCLSCFETKHSK